mmetsp:Transcript_28891/g.65326  ORF Transcript_28891/g.65326 Transcript_28891/m.65326 type:complete len:341 (-) Transcript_28891:726-1748(-)
MDRAGRLQSKVLNAQGAATHCVGLLISVLLPTDAEGQLVDEISCCCLLPIDHVFALRELLVACTDFGDAVQQSPRTVVLEHVWLALEATGGTETHVFGLPQEAVLEGGDPLYGVLMHDILVGVARHVQDGGDVGVLGYVDHNALRESPRLQQPLLWVLTTSTEELRRLQPEGAQLLPHTVDNRMGEEGRLRIVLSLQDLFLLLGPVEPLLALLFSPPCDIIEVALREFLDGSVFGQHILEDLPEVGEEQLLLLVLRASNGREVRRYLLSLDVQLDPLTFVKDPDPVRLVLWCVHEAVVLERVPLLRSPLPAQGTVLPLPPPVDGLVVVLRLHEHLLRGWR